MNLATSTVGNSDSLASAELINSFISGEKDSDLPNYTFQVTDGIKTASFNGAILKTLASVWGMVTIEWHVTRGGRRETESAPVPTMSALFTDNPDAS
jgi:hypothetical protein